MFFDHTRLIFSCTVLFILQGASKMFRSQKLDEQFAARAPPLNIRGTNGAMPSRPPRTAAFRNMTGVFLGSVRVFVMLLYTSTVKFCLLKACCVFRMASGNLRIRRLELDVDVLCRLWECKQQLKTVDMWANHVVTHYLRFYFTFGLPCTWVFLP